MLKEKIIIFLDGEMLTEPDFIENHYSHHIGKKDMVVCGAFHYRGIYTFLTSKLVNIQQWQHIDEFVASNPYYSLRYEEFKMRIIKIVKVYSHSLLTMI